MCHHLGGLGAGRRASGRSRRDPGQPCAGADALGGGRRRAAGLRPDTAITLGRAVAGSSARIKARAIGLAEAKQEGDGLHEAAKGAAPAKTVRLLGRDVLVAEGKDGLRALDQGNLAAPGPARAYVEHALGAHLPAVRKAMDGVVQSEVTHRAW